MKPILLLAGALSLTLPSLVLAEDPSDNRFTGRVIGWAYLNDEDREPSLGGRMANDFSGVGLGVEWENMSIPHLGIAVGLDGTSNAEHRWVRDGGGRNGTMSGWNEIRTTMDLLALDLGARFHTAENFDALDFFAGGGFSIYAANLRAESPGQGRRGEDMTWYDIEDQGAGLHIDLGLLVPISQHFAVGLTERLSSGLLEDTEVDVSNNRLSVDLALKF